MIQQKDDLEEAVRNLRSLWFVGILEHYKASLCLLMFQLQLPMTSCSCEGQAAAQHVHERHGIPKEHPTHVLPAAVRAKIEGLSAVDKELYRAAVAEFRERIAYVEATIGDTILCTS